MSKPLKKTTKACIIKKIVVMEIKRIDQTENFFAIIPKDLKDEIIYISKTATSTNEIMLGVEFLLIALCKFATTQKKTITTK